MEKEVCRLEGTEDWYDDEKEEEVCREGPALEAPFATALPGRGLEYADLGLYGSPPCSTRVLRPGGFAGGGAIENERALLAEADIS